LFLSDHHWQHQASRLLLFAKPINIGPRWARKTNGMRQPGDDDAPSAWMPKGAVLTFAFKRFDGAIGRLAYRAASELKRREVQRLNPTSGSSPVEGSSLPFFNLDQLFHFNPNTKD